MDRVFATFEAKVASNVMKPSKNPLFLGFGLVYRTGWQGEFIKLYPDELIDESVFYNDIGLELSTEYSIPVFKRWTLGIGGTYQRYFQRTKAHMRGSVAIGYSFGQGK